MLEFVETSVENRAATKADLQQAVSDLREELHREASRVEMGLRKEIQEVRTDVLKWSFAFWVGNVAVMSGILFAMLRSFRQAGPMGR